MSNLADALTQVKDALLEGVDLVDTLHEAAKDYGLKIEFILRKFTEANNLTPQAWLIRQKQLIADREQLKIKSIEAAQARAIDIAMNKWKVSGKGAELAGRLFHRAGLQYAYVVMGADDPRFAVRAVSVNTGKITNFPKSDCAAILKQIAPEVRLVA